MSKRFTKDEAAEIFRRAAEASRGVAEESDDGFINASRLAEWRKTRAEQMEQMASLALELAARPGARIARNVPRRS